MTPRECNAAVLSSLPRALPIPVEATILVKGAILRMVRTMVTTQTEEYARAKGDEKVSHARLNQFAAEQGMTPEFMERFQKKQKSA